MNTVKTWRHAFAIPAKENKSTTDACRREIIGDNWVVTRVWRA